MTGTFWPGPSDGTVRDASGAVHRVPDGWALLLPGDAALTRRVKAAGDHCVVQEWRKRKLHSLGVWAPAAVIERLRGELAEERSAPGFAKRRASDAKRREVAQTKYVDEFRAEVLAFLDFPPVHAALAARLADAVTAHATPVGSGTVARTKRIPVERRAEAAVIAWMRHQTTAYDEMSMPRMKGHRREVRRTLAAHSRELLDGYRAGRPMPDCPLAAALDAMP